MWSEAVDHDAERPIKPTQKMAFKNLLHVDLDRGDRAPLARNPRTAALPHAGVPAPGRPRARRAQARRRRARALPPTPSIKRASNMDDEAILRSLAALNAHTNSIEARLFSMKSEPSTPSQPRADHGSTEELYEEPTRRCAAFTP